MKVCAQHCAKQPGSSSLNCSGTCIAHARRPCAARRLAGFASDHWSPTNLTVLCSRPVVSSKRRRSPPVSFRSAGRWVHLSFAQPARGMRASAYLPGRSLNGQVSRACSGCCSPKTPPLACVSMRMLKRSALVWPASVASERASHTDVFAERQSPFAEKNRAECL